MQETQVRFLVERGSSWKGRLRRRWGSDARLQVLQGADFGGHLNRLREVLG